MIGDPFLIAVGCLQHQREYRKEVAVENRLEDDQFGRHFEECFDHQVDVELRAQPCWQRLLDVAAADDKYHQQRVGNSDRFEHLEGEIACCAKCSRQEACNSRCKNLVARLVVLQK